MAARKSKKSTHKSRASAARKAWKTRKRKYGKSGTKKGHRRGKR